MHFILISTFTLAMYAGQATAQPPATQATPATTRAGETDEVETAGRGHARAAQRMARARHAARHDTDQARSGGGLPVTETVVSEPPSDPDPDR